MPIPSYRPRLRDLRPLVPAAAPAAAPTLAPALARVTPAGDLAGRAGYDPAHLPDFAVALPSTAGVRSDVRAVPGRDDGRLDYTHFSVVLSASRRLALFTAANLDGAQSVSVPRGGDPWALDGRLPADAQVGEELYADNDFDRGHLVRREDPNWGADAATANRDTFHFTNCAPQLSAYNQQTWLGLEDLVLGNTRRQRERASVFTGPVFRADDPVYRGVAIPLAYWKVIAFVHDDGTPSATAYMIDHDVDLGRVELIFGPYKTYQRSVAAVERATGLDFGALTLRDGFSNEEAATGARVERVIRVAADVLV
ncbi:DNA/RNA non-specific endonuclease [Sphingomonas sp. BK580]|uniref:DNA/RNA non-specific endonuclease n=1 Tax=Sphingomonas sp. BK580 TaxID=2586972 RepID=UPI00161FECDE|nr:DNA/RNA non-specific endonuclease [Sphingomonas sp. BK580]MBB3695018.1 endonuclease G [Sphingomonas sp. BK580]